MSFFEVTAQLSKGFLTTLMVFGVTLVCSLPLGLIITFGSMSKFPPIKWLTKTFVWIIRGTPLMLQIIIIFYGPGLLGLDFKFDRLTAVLVSFVINYSCYFSEIYRGGIESIPKGQYEAGQVLGMTKTQIFFRVVLFQVIKRIVPPMSTPFWSGIMSITGYSNLPNSAELAPSRPATWRANSITAICIPRHSPRYGSLCSRA